MKGLLDRIGAGEGLWAMAMTGLGTIAGLLVGKCLSGGEFVSAFTIWVTTVFGSAAIAGFRDWNKPAPPKP